MKWEHKVSKDWLEARRHYLTASDIRELIPAYKDFIKSFDNYLNKKKLPQETSILEIPPKDAEKMLKRFINKYLIKSNKQEVITSSPSNDAARGHYCEPFAVEEYNNAMPSSDAHQMWHWDDALITDEKNSVINYPLAYSPDALDIVQYSNDIKHIHISNGKELIGAGTGEWHVSPTQVLEIKSYGPKKHAAKILENKMAHEERYQIATAMAVSKSITLGHIIFYDPRCIRKFKIDSYTREELSKEITMVKLINELFNCTVEIYNTIYFDEIKNSLYSEQDIINSYLHSKTKPVKNIIKGE